MEENTEFRKYDPDLLDLILTELQKKKCSKKAKEIVNDYSGRTPFELDELYNEAKRMQFTDINHFEEYLKLYRQ